MKQPTTKAAVEFVAHVLPLVRRVRCLMLRGTDLLLSFASVQASVEVSHRTKDVTE